MFDKYKRYRERKKDHRIALKMDVELLLKEVSGLPAVCAEASATLGRERKVVALPTRPVASGKVSWPSTVAFSCTVYRDAVQAGSCEPKIYKLSLTAKGEAGRPVFVGREEIDISQFVFKGTGGQPLTLKLPVYSKGDRDGQLNVVTLHALITTQLAKEASKTTAAIEEPAASRASFPSSMSSGMSEPSAVPDEEAAETHNSESSKPAGAGMKGIQPGQRTSATRIAHVRSRLKEKAARLSAGVAQQPFPGSEQPSEHGEAEEQKHQRTPKTIKKTSGSRSLGASGHRKQPQSDRELLGLERTASGPRRQPAVEKESGPDDLSELNDSLSEMDSEPEAPMPSTRTSRDTPPTASNRSWGAVKTPGDTVSQGSLQAADLSLRSRSDILTLFSKGDTAEATAKPLPPALQSADLPYSDSSDGESSSDGEHSANKDPAEQHIESKEGSQRGGRQQPREQPSSAARSLMVNTQGSKANDGGNRTRHLLQPRAKRCLLQDRSLEAADEDSSMRSAGEVSARTMKAAPALQREGALQSPNEQSTPSKLTPLEEYAPASPATGRLLRAPRASQQESPRQRLATLKGPVVALPSSNSQDVSESEGQGRDATSTPTTQAAQAFAAAMPAQRLVRPRGSLREASLQRRQSEVKAAVDLAGDGPVQKLSDSLKVAALSESLSGSREQKLSEELQRVRRSLADAHIVFGRGSRQVDPALREAIARSLTAATQHADAAKEIAEVLKTDVLRSSTRGQTPAGNERRLPANTEEASGDDLIGAPGQKEQPRRKLQLVSAVGSKTHEEHRPAADRVEALERELAATRTALEVAEKDSDTWAARCKELQSQRSSAEKEDFRSSAPGSGRTFSSTKGAMTDLDAQQDSPTHSRQASSQSTVSQLKLLLEQHSKLKEENASLVAQMSREHDEKAKLQQRLEDADRKNKQLENEVELMRRESGEGASEMAVAVAVAAKDAEIAGLQRELLDLELQAQEEIGEMHEELLEMRRSHQAVELALKDSEQKRAEMQLQTQQMEQQLQETAGELAEVERELQRRLQFSAVKFTKTAGLPRAVSEESDLGPGTPPALHPARATQDESSTAGQPPRPAYEALSREFDAVMQELVQRKMELAELSEDYERVCHAFLRADEATNGPILAQLRKQGAFMRQDDVQAALHATAV